MDAEGGIHSAPEHVVAGSGVAMAALEPATGESEKYLS